MSLEVLPLRECDIPAVVTLYRKAFCTPLQLSFFDHPSVRESPAIDAESVRRMRKKLLGQTDCIVLKIVERAQPGGEAAESDNAVPSDADWSQEGDGSPPLLAYAIWYLRLRVRDRKEIERSTLVEPLRGPGVREEPQMEFYSNMYNARKKYLTDRPHLFLEYLATHPDHQRKGAGGMLLRWGCEHADGANLPIFLEASGEGVPLYEKFGFEEIEEVFTDLAKYGGEGVDRHIIMIRWPQGRGSGRQQYKAEIEAHR